MERFVRLLFAHVVASVVVMLAMLGWAMSEHRAAAFGGFLCALVLAPLAAVFELARATARAIVLAADGDLSLGAVLYVSTIWVSYLVPFIGIC